MKAVSRGLLGAQSETEQDAAGAREQAETLLVQGVGACLRTDAPVVHAWRTVAQRLGMTPPPRRLPARYHADLLRYRLRTLEPGLEASEQFGIPTSRAFELARLTGSPDSWASEVPGLSSEAMDELIRGGAQALLLYAPFDDGESKALADFLGTLAGEVLHRDARSRQGRALPAEVLALRAVMAALKGNADTARRSLMQAEVTLRTRERLAAWSGSESLEPPRTPGLPLTSHALWLQCRGLCEAVCGYLKSAVVSFQQALDLFLAAEAYFAAGVCAASRSAVLQWQGRPQSAVEPLELAFELLDLRAMNRLERALRWDLLQLSAVREPTSRYLRSSLESRTNDPGLRAVDELWATGLHDLKHGRVTRARERLLQVWERSSTRDPMKLLLAVDLAQVEIAAGFPQLADDWLGEGQTSLSWIAESVALRREWAWVRAQGNGLESLRAGILRALAFPQSSWCAERDGSILDTSHG